MARAKQQYNEAIGSRIKESRIKKGFSRQTLADKLANLSFSKDEYKNISGSLSAVKSWEGIGRKYSPDNTTLKAISEILEVDFNWLLYGTVSDIIDETRRILSNFVPTKETTSQYDSKTFSWNGNPIPDELAKSISLLYPLVKNGYKINDIRDKKQFSEYMESSNKNSIEFYMNNLNKKDGE